MRIACTVVYYIVKCQLSHSHNFTKTSAVTSVITTEQSAVIYNGGVWDYGLVLLPCYDMSNTVFDQ